MRTHHRAAPRRCALALGAALVLSACPPAQARTSCGTETAKSAGQIFGVVAGGVGCTTAKTVAGGWFQRTSRGKSGRAVADQLQRTWTCVITQRATGTDPGLIPFTSVRCRRHSAVVRFRQRS